MKRKPITEVVPGQVPAFFPIPMDDDLPVLGKKDKKPGLQRAGTVIDHRWAHSIMGTGKRRTQQGLYDESQRLYQTGGDLDKFVFWKLKLVSISYEAWVQVVNKVDWIEIIDHARNECWRLPMGRGRKHAVMYDAGIGRRVGVPIKHWDVVTHRGTIRQNGEG